MNNSWSITLSPGGKWSGIIGFGKLVRFTALQEGANVSMLLFHARDLTERYNMPDSLKAQYTAHLTKGNVLMGDNGRILASFVEDSLGWHDTITGFTTREQTDAKYGKTTYQALRNDWLRSGQENLSVELIRSGLSMRDFHPNVNLFSKVYCDDNGSMHYSLDHCKEGSTVTLRTEMDNLFILSNTPNPLDPRTEYPSVPVKIEVLDADAVDSEDYCLNYRPENRRAFKNTWEYFTLLGK